MSGFPSFLNILPAVIAAAVAVPLLLLLYFLKLRRREVAVSSTLLWKKAVQDLQVNAPFQRLRRNLLLFLQMLLLALLLLALARPILNYTPGAGKVSVILIDRSASMSAADANGKTRLAEAKSRAKELIDTLGPGQSAMVIAFDEIPEIVRTFTSDRAELKKGVDSIRPTDRRSRLKQAYQLAEAQAANFDPDQLRPNVDKPELRLYSDGRVLDVSELALRWADVKYEKIGSDQADNIAIVALSAKRNYERPSEVQVFARLANYGDQPVDADVQLTVDGDTSLMRVAPTRLMPERWTAQQREQAAKEQSGPAAGDSVEFTLDLLTSAVIKVEQKARDLLPADDVAYVVVPPPRALSVLLVTNGENYFLENAFQSLRLEKRNTVVPQAYETMMHDPAAVAGKYDLIIFDSYQPTALPPSGNFIYFRAAPPGSKLQAAMDGDKQVIVNDNTVLDWNRDHPIFRHLNLGTIYVGEMLKLEPPIDAEVLLEGMKGPMVVLYREGRSTHLVVSFDTLKSSWPFKRHFPIFINRAVQYLAVGSDMDVRESYPPGATPRIPRTNLQQAGADLKQIKLHGPGIDKTLDIPLAGDFALPALDKVGVYTLEPPVPQFDRLAVNLLDENESNLVPLDYAPGDGGAAVVKAGAGKSRLELWWWLVACAAIPLCLVEWWVYTRRMHL